MTEKQVPENALRMLQVFEEGKRFTEDLMKENENLRLVVAKLKNESKELEKKYIQVDVPRMREKMRILEAELHESREENEELRNQFSSVEEENREFADRYIQVERQNSDLINMYVATYRLHSTLDYDEVLQVVKEIIINMIGTESFGIYLIDEKEKRLVMIANEGLDVQSNESVPLAEGSLGKAAQTGQIVLREDVHTQNADSEPIACVPLKVGDRVMGVIGIQSLLLQKDGFQALDHELFEMLGGHAATAIYGARLYSVSERKRSTLEGFIDLIKSDGS